MVEDTNRVGSCSDVKSIHQPLKLASAPTYRKRTILLNQRVQDRDRKMVQKQIEENVNKINEGLTTASEGIAIFLGPGRSGLRNRYSTLFDRVKNGWRGGDNDRVPLKAQDAKDSEKAQGLIKVGLKKVEDAASKLNRYLRQGYNDPRLAKAVAYAEAVEPLYNALRGDRDPTDFKAKCQVVVDCDPL